MYMTQKRIFRQWLLIGILSLTIATLNIIRVIMGAFQIPDGQVYLAIGHSYLDYLEYTQQIAQGIYGHLLIQNQFTTHDPTQTLIGWGQYLLIGYVARLFHASPFLAYWAAVFVLSVCVLLITFLLIRKILRGQPFVYQLTAFLFTVFAVPFVTVSGTLQQLTVKPVEFFYSPISLFHRLGGVPHHLTTTLCICTGLILIAAILKNGMGKMWNRFYPETGLFIGLCIVTLTFAPLQIITLLSATGIVTFGYLWWFWMKKKEPGHGIHFLVLLFLLCITIVPAALFIKSAHGSQELFLRAIAWERTQQHHPTLFELLFTIGPVLFLVLFGLRPYFKSATPLKFLLFFFVLFSYFYFSTDLAYLMGTFTQRFLTPVSYVFFGITAALGVQEITRRIPFRNMLSGAIITLCLLYFLAVTLWILRSFGGSNTLGYMPKDYFTGFRILNKQNDTKAVLTSSYGNLGLLVPSIIDRNVYLGRFIFTPDFPKKQHASDQFYVGNMSPQDAYLFLRENNIGYIFISSGDPYPKQNMLKYPFISELYTNPALTILQFHE